MRSIDRAMGLRCKAAALAQLILATAGCAPVEDRSPVDAAPVADQAIQSSDPPAAVENRVQVRYLEIVSDNVDATCETYEKLHGVTFGEPDPALGGARTTSLPGGGMLGVRAPLRETEAPIVRPYLLVDDIESAVAEAADSGAEIALPPMELRGHGRCAVFIQEGVEHGLWQVDPQ